MAGTDLPKSPQGGLKAFACKNCGGQVQLLAPGQSISAACQHCGTVVDLTDPNMRILSREKAAVRPDLKYEIGSKAKFEGKDWVLVGMMSRIVEQYGFEWEEYLLFNPFHGFRFLAYAYGHWSWIKMVRDMPLEYSSANYLSYKNQHFKYITEGLAKVTYVIGEFFWQVKIGDKAETRDLISPPYMLSAELERGGVVWSLGEYLEPSVVAKAFGSPPKAAQSRRSAGANQPNPYQRQLKWVLPTWIVAMVLTFAIFFVTGATAPDAAVHEITARYPNALDSLSGPFEIGEEINNVGVYLQALSGLDNHWVEVEGVLHNVETNDNYEFVVGAEYYYGVDDGERWSEGSTYGSSVINEVPQGKYELIITSSSDSIGDVKIQLKRAVPIFTNMIWMLLGLSILPIILIVLKVNFEKQRNE
jgi:hypothetical protein